MDCSAYSYSFVHTNPFPGNVNLIYDFGILVEECPPTKYGLFDLVFAISCNKTPPSEALRRSMFFSAALIIALIDIHNEKAYIQHTKLQTTNCVNLLRVICYGFLMF